MNNPVPVLVTEVRPHEDMEPGSIPVTLYADNLGEQGPQGIQGVPGQKGADGATGPQGPQGVPGAQGIQGPKGERGSDGTSIVIDGYVDTVGDLPDLTGQLPGPSYIVMENGHIHFWNGTGFTDGGNVTGPAGADGADGAQGPAGIDGAVGAPGPRGEQGEPGPEGPQGPQGPRGIQGLQGVQGLPGAPGADGTPGPPGAPGEGVPAGGSSGQVLVKASSADYDTEWVSDLYKPEDVGFSYIKSGSVVPDDTSQYLDFGSYRIRVRLWATNLRVAYLELTSITGSGVPTDHSMIGYASSVTSGSPGVSGNTGSRVTIASGSWVTVSGRAEHANFVIHDRTTNQTWEGVCSAPWNGTQPVGYVLRITRIA